MKEEKDIPEKMANFRNTVAFGPLEAEINSADYLKVTAAHYME